MPSKTIYPLPPGRRVVAAMSGGVDSAVAAGLLAEAGYDVIGVTMKMYEATRTTYARSCCGSEDFDDARRSAAILGIPHFVLDYTGEFRRGVIDRFVEAYRSGRTPNPCIACNTFIKLGALRRYAASIGAEAIATGHYARLLHDAEGPHLYRAGHAKDQAYALAALRRDQLAGLILPLGERTKDETRREAGRLRLPVEKKPDSQDICFVEGGDYRTVLAQYDTAAPVPSGAFQDSDGAHLGEHSGIVGYTIGQRARIGGEPRARYVTRIDATTNTIVLGDADELEARILVAGDVNRLRPDALLDGADVTAMIRAHAVPARAQLGWEDDFQRLRLTFEQPQRAITPGQVLVLLDPATDEVLGSATIEGAQTSAEA